MHQLPKIDDSPLLPILEASSDGVGIAVPRPWRLVHANPTLSRWLGSAPSELRGRTVESAFDPAGLEGLSACLDSVLGGNWGVRYAFDEVVLPGGGTFPVEIRLQPIDVDGERLVAIIMCDREPGTSGEPLLSAAGRDPLT